MSIAPGDMRLEFADVAIDLWPFALIGLAAVLVIVWVRKRSLSYLLCGLIFGLYLLLAVEKVFFPLQVSGFYAESMRQDRAFSAFVNVIPFYFGPFSSLNDALVTLMQNILLTIPFGFGVSFVAPLRPRQFLWLPLAVGLGIEAAQLVISLLLGYPYRFIDVNDVLMNALGVWIGYGVFCAFAWLYLRVIGTPRAGLVRYIGEVAARSGAAGNRREQRRIAGLQ